MTSPWFYLTSGINFWCELKPSVEHSSQNKQLRVSSIGIKTRFSTSLHLPPATLLPKGPPADHTCDLRLLHTCDVHVHLSAFDYDTQTSTLAGGLSRTATLIREARREAAHSLLFDTGDFLQGSLLGDVLNTQGPESNTPHPAIVAMNLLHYDAVTLGNHEFSFGLDYLKTALSDAEFDVVLANAHRHLRSENGDAGQFLPAYKLLSLELSDTRGHPRQIKLGIIGFTPPQTAIWDRHHVQETLTFSNFVDSARIWVPKLKSAGADLVIALCHTGISAAGSAAEAEHAALSLSKVEGIDVLLCGHQHLVFPGPKFHGIAGVDAVKGTLNGKPATMPGYWGDHLGVIDLSLSQSDDQTWHIHDHTCTVRPVIAPRATDAEPAAQTPEAPDILRAVQPHHDRTLRHSQKIIGSTQHPLNSYFSMITSDAALQLIAQAKHNFMRQALNSTPYGALPLLTAVAPFKAGGHAGPSYFVDIPAGSLTLRDLATLYPFPNVISAVKLTGADLWQWLERISATFQKITPGQQDQPLHRTDVPSYAFDHLFGLSYAFDLSRAPAGSENSAGRVSHVHHNGTAIDDQQEFIVACSGYRASGGGLARLDPAKTVVQHRTNIRDILERHIRQSERRDPALRSDWGFCPLPHTSVTFLSGPTAGHHLHEHPNLSLTELGQNIDGFARIRLAL